MSNIRHPSDDHHDTSTSSSSSFSTSSSCSSPDTQKKDYVLLNDKSRRKKRAFIPDEKKDPTYWSQRSKNNLSAKRSRVKRRMNDLVLETKLSQLTNENQVLRAKIDMLARKFGHLTNEEDGGSGTADEDMKKIEQTEVTNLLDLSPPSSSCESKTKLTEEQTLLEKPPMPMKWRFKLFNMTSNS